MSRSSRRSARSALVLAVAGVSVAGQLVLLPASTAVAATALTVSTTADVPAGTGACGNPATTTAPSPLSLREATCLADNTGGEVTITVPAGTYSLTSGPLVVGTAPGRDVRVVGAGAASTVVTAGYLSRVVVMDPSATGGVALTLTGLTLAEGADDTFGGAGVLGGSVDAAQADSLTLVDSVVRDNRANTGSTTRSNAPGGGIQFIGGRLTLTRTTVAGNTSGASAGSGVAYEATGATPGEALTITGGTFSTNRSTSPTAGLDNGGALVVRGAGTATVDGVRFVDNAADATAGAGTGAAIWAQSGQLSVRHSTFTGNQAAGPAGSGGAVAVAGGTADLRFNRFTANTAANGSALSSNAAAVATSNWWGCSTGPGTPGCDTVRGPATVTPRLTLLVTAAPPTVQGPGASSTVRAALTTDSGGSAVAPADLTAFSGLPVTFADPPGDATVGGSAGPRVVPLAAGVAEVGYQSGTVSGPSPVTATLDAGTGSGSVVVQRAPAFTGATTAALPVSTPASVAVTTTGYPAPAITTASTLPAGVLLSDAGDGTATLSGTPAAGSEGTYPVLLKAANGTTDATTTLTLTVYRSPAFTSPATATLVAGTPATVAVTTSAAPAVTSVALVSGTLPAGLTLSGTGAGRTLSGTPTTAGTSVLRFTATNGFAPDAVQDLVVTVQGSPVVTTQPADQDVAPGPVTLTAAASGSPTPTVQWQRAAPGGAFADVPGATSTSLTVTLALADDGVRFRAVFTNPADTATTRAATVSVGTAPAFVTPATGTLRVGTAGSVPLEVSGSPAATVRATTALPSWLTLTPQGGGRATLSGTPPVGAGGVLTIGLAAANNRGQETTQSFSLVVDESPRFTSGSTATFTAGAAGTVLVATTGGHPTPVTVTGAALPGWLTLTDQGNGSALLTGTPPAGSGGTSTVTLTARTTGGSAGATTQTLTVRVDESPTLSVPATASVAVGSALTVAVSTSGGFPAPPALTATSTPALPAGLALVDAGDGTATLRGTPGAGSGGVYRVVVTATPGGTAAPATAPLELTVLEPPAFTSTDRIVLSTGSPARFVVTTSAGRPAGPVAVTVDPATLPAGLTSTDVGDGTAVLSGVPTTDGTTVVTYSASNGLAPAATQQLTIRVAAAAAVTLPPTAPAAAAPLLGLAATTPRGAPVVVSGDGCAPGAVVTVALYPGAVELARTTADASGVFSTPVSLGDAPGQRVLVSGCTGLDGGVRFLSSTTTVVAVPPPGSTGTGTLPAPGLLARTGPAVEVLTLLLVAGAALVGGAWLTRVARRRA